MWPLVNIKKSIDLASLICLVSCLHERNYTNTLESGITTCFPSPLLNFHPESSPFSQKSSTTIQKIEGHFVQLPKVKLQHVGYHQIGKFLICPMLWFVTLSFPPIRYHITILKSLSGATWLANRNWPIKSSETMICVIKLLSLFSPEMREWWHITAKLWPLVRETTVLLGRNF